MKKSNKKLLVLAAAGAMTVASAVPALALENELHGFFRTYFDASNFTINKSGASIATDNGTGAGVIGSQPFKKNLDDANFFETRLRMNYAAKINDDTKIVSRFETNYRFWGNSAFTAGRAEGGAIGSRGVNLETKQVYLDLNIPSVKLNTKIGMQPWTDDLQGIFVDSDMPGVLLTHSYDKAAASFGFFRLNDNGNNKKTYGKETKDLYILNAACEHLKDTKLGASYYFFNGNTPTGYSQFGLSNWDPTSAQLHILGLNGQTKFGPVAVDGFVAAQFGKDHLTQRKIVAYAANAGAKMAVGPGTLRANFLYTSGDNDKGSDNAWRVASSTDADFYNNEMVILGRDKVAMVNDNALIYNPNNNNQGALMGALGYDMDFTSKLSGSANVGFAAVDKLNSVTPLDTFTGKPNGSKYLGTEINAEANYKVNTNTTLGVRGGYAFLGDYWKGTAADGAVKGLTPNDLYDFKIIATVVF